MLPPVNRNVQRGHATREHLLAIATRLFAERGYEQTSIEAVLHEAGISRGALYHHFASKEALFDAVLQEIELRVGREVQAAARVGREPFERLRLGCQAWLRLASDPVVQRVLLLDALSVLGWERWRDMDERYAMGMTRAAVRDCAAPARIPPDLVEMFAHVLFAALDELALLIARAANTAPATRLAERAVDELIRRLLKPAS